ncbi:MAG: PIN domain nuclease [Armatimonadota bacterium]
MRKLTLYLETSVPNALLADSTPERQRATERLFEELRQGVHEAAVSDLVIQELAQAPQGIRERLMEAVGSASPVRLTVEAAALDLADEFVAMGLIPARYVADARHLACAIVGEVDALVSWNLRHIVRLRTRREANAVAVLRGYRPIEICTPEEVVGSAQSGADS